jgi:hypothetical protein
MQKRLTYAVFFTVLGGYIFTGAHLSKLVADDKDDAYQQLEVFTRVLERVRKDYVDGDKLTYKDLVQGALKGMLGSLDPHSEYMEPVKYGELKEDTEGSFSGVGLQVGIKDGGLVVISPMEDTPAFEVGIMTGDRIEKIDGQSTERFGMNDAVKRLPFYDFCHKELHRRQRKTAARLVGECDGGALCSSGSIVAGDFHRLIKPALHNSCVCVAAFVNGVFGGRLVSRDVGDV